MVVNRYCSSAQQKSKILVQLIQRVEAKRAVKISDALGAPLMKFHRGAQFAPVALSSSMFRFPL